MRKLSSKEWNILHSDYLLAEGENKIKLRKQLIESQLRYLVKPCQRYARYYPTLFEDLIMAGYDKIDRALDDFDPKYKITFWGFCRTNILHAIQAEHHKIVFGQVSGYYTQKDMKDFAAGITKNRPNVISMDYRLPDDEDDDGFVSKYLPVYNITPLDSLCEGVRLEELLSTLRPDRKQIVLDWAINGMSLLEIGRQQGISKKAVESRLSYALIEIKRHGLESGLLDKRFFVLPTKYRIYWGRYGEDKQRQMKRKYYLEKKMKIKEGKSAPAKE